MEIEQDNSRRQESPRHGEEWVLGPLVIQTWGEGEEGWERGQQGRQGSRGRARNPLDGSEQRRNGTWLMFHRENKL